MWLEKIFRIAGDHCSGFIETEENIILKNHLHWAHIKVRGDGKKVSRGIELTNDGHVYTIPIWVEASVTIREEVERREVTLVNPLDNSETMPFLTKDPEDLRENVGTTEERKTLNSETRVLQSKDKGPFRDVAGQIKKGGHLRSELPN